MYRVPVETIRHRCEKQRPYLHAGTAEQFADIRSGRPLIHAAQFQSINVERDAALEVQDV
ncbi:hypothetical protein M1D93_00795 [Arthrobacter sp. Z1-9]